MTHATSKILAVDDRPENLYALATVLQDSGAELVTAASGQEALAATLNHDFALALLDVQMPEMDGYELATLLRGDPKTSNLPIIFLTAFSLRDAQIFRGYESGAVDYIVKPYEPVILQSKVRVLLGMHRQQRVLEQQRATLQALNEELEAFTYSVSHDLRAPLRAINGFAEILVEDHRDALAPDAAQLLDRVTSEGHRMERLIEDLLRLSRVARVELNPTQIDLAEIAQRILGRLRETEPSRRVVLIAPESLPVVADAGLVEQALDNLLSNAWKFTSERDSARIEIGLAHHRGEQALFVRDNGVGFDPRYASRLFSPFQRLHDAQRFPGTGVGLSTVRRIVRRHGGWIRFESAPEQGATFFFTLRPGGPR